MYDEIKNKLIEMHLFSGNPDTSLFLINESFKTILPDNIYFNDLMELRDFINHFYTVPGCPFGMVLVRTGRGQEKLHWYSESKWWHGAQAITVGSTTQKASAIKVN